MGIVNFICLASYSWAMSGEVRMVSIQGGAASDYLKEGRKGRRARTARATQHRQRQQDGGFDTAPGPSMRINSGANAMIRNATRTLRGGENESSVVQNTPSASALPTEPASSAFLTVQGGAKKLILVPKKTTARLHLAPPKSKRRVLHTRKIRVHLSGLKKRITHAKTIHHESRSKSIHEIRKLLEDARLVKPAKEGKQVPESVLRDIYKDYMLLRGRAL